MRGMRRFALVVAWLGATVLVTTTAWAVVSAVENRVSDRPLTPLIATTVAANDQTTTTTTLPPVTDPSAEEAPSTTDHEPTTTTTTVPRTTITTEGSVGSTGNGGPRVTTTTTTTSTTVPTTTTTEDTTTTTTSPDEWETKTVGSPGGTVTIRHRPGEVVLIATQAAPGFYVEVDDTGPPEVKVEFEDFADTVKVKVKIRYENGVLVEDITEDQS